MPRQYCIVPKCKKWGNLSQEGVCPHHVIQKNRDKGTVVYNATIMYLKAKEPYYVNVVIIGSTKHAQKRYLLRYTMYILKRV